MKISLFAICIMVTFTSCLGTMSLQNRVFDNDRYVVKEEDSFTYGERTGRTVNNRTAIQFSSFSGMDTIVRIKGIQGGELKVSYISDITEGEFRIVLISPENKVFQILNHSDKGMISFDLDKGISRIKIVGREASGTLQFEIEGDFKSDYGR